MEQFVVDGAIQLPSRNRVPGAGQSVDWEHLVPRTCVSLCLPSESEAAVSLLDKSCPLGLSVNPFRVWYCPNTPFLSLAGAVVGWVVVL